jgi:hypothetical protein
MKKAHFIKRSARKFDNWSYGARRFLVRHRRCHTGARIGIFVAYYDASWVFEDHLRCVRDMTAGSFNYYVMGNCTTAQEQSRFDELVKDFGFPVPFAPWPYLMPYTHGESLQRLIDRTDDDIIVLCDVDAFPVKYGWDDFIVSELATKDVVAVVVDMPHRTMPVFLHPCFMAFRRGLLADNGLDVLPAGEGDPGCKITTYLHNAGRLTPAHVTPLFPTRREIELSPPGANQFFGRSDLVHGFGTTYADMIFHFWFARHIARKMGVSDSGTNLSEAEVGRVVSEVFGRLRSADVPGK